MIVQTLRKTLPEPSRPSIDIEALVVRAYRDELVHAAMGGASVSGAGAPASMMAGSGWRAVETVALLGTWVDGGAGGHEPPAWALEVHRAVVGLGPVAAAVVVRYARVGARPEWDFPAPLVWRGIPARNGRGVKVERYQGEGHVLTWCPIVKDFAVEAAMLGRAEWSVWWEALDAVRAVVEASPAVRERWVVGPPKARRTPWVDKPLELDHPTEA